MHEASDKSWLKSPFFTLKQNFQVPLRSIDFKRIAILSLRYLNSKLWGHLIDKQETLLRNQFKSKSTNDYIIKLIRRRNKRPIGHIAHLRNQFKSMNTLEQNFETYQNHWLGEQKTMISFLRIEWSLFVKPWAPFTQRCFLPCLVEIG